MATTKPTGANSIDEYIAQIDEPRRSEIVELDELISATVPKLERHLMGQMGSQMIGYGPYHYKYASGREGDTAIISLASQKRHISVYVMCVDNATGEYLPEQFEERLGKVSVGKSCVRFTKLENIDRKALKSLLMAAEKNGGAARAEH